MKIAQVTSYFQPEFGYDEYYVSRNLARLGHDVSVVTSDKIYPFKNVEKLLAEIGSEHTTRKRSRGIQKMDGFTVYRLPSVAELFLDLNLVMNIRSALKKIKPELVHLHEPILGGSAMAAGHKDLGYKLVVDQHSYATTFEETETLKNRFVHYQYILLRKRFANYAFKRADAIVAVTERTKKFLVEFFSVPEEKIEVVSLGVDEKLFSFNPEARERIRNELKVAEDTPLIITAGRFDRAKKLDQLIRAFAGLRQQQKARLVVIGTGDDEIERELHQLVKKLMLGKSVTFIKFVKKSLLSSYYSAADIGFWNKASITIIEAMGCKLPVVLPDQGTIKNYVENKNGLLFPEDDVDSLQEQLLELAVNVNRREQMGKRALELVEKRFSYKVTTKKLLGIYQRCLNE
ncbi:glycosyltransferase family 4 protein [[Eubacterium] cellulosolvens]